MSTTDEIRAKAIRWHNQEKARDTDDSPPWPFFMEQAYNEACRGLRDAMARRDQPRTDKFLTLANAITDAYPEMVQSITKRENDSAEDGQ